MKLKMIPKALVLSCTMLSTNLYADEYIIALPDSFQNDAIKSALSEAIQETVLSISAGDTVRVMNAFNHTTIAKFSIPNKKAFKHSKVRKKQFRKRLKQLDERLDAIQMSDSKGNRLLLPQFLDHISTQLFPEKLSEDEKVNVLIYGDALYMDSRDAFFNMEDGWFPSDGHIKESHRKSIYGTLEKGDKLKNYHIHFVHSNMQENWISTLYEQRIKRFWGLLVSSMGGSLSTFSPDLTATTDRFLQSGKSAANQYAFDHTVNKVERLKLWRESEPQERVITQVLEDNTEQPPTCLSEDVPITTAPPSTLKANNIIIGIRWDNCENCDLDLYATTRSNPWLSYKNTKTAQGQYFKDFTSAPNVNGLEFVQLTKPTQFADIKTMVNLYSGNANANSTGNLRICFNGNTYEHAFKLNAVAGNGGKGMSEASESPNWAVLDIPAILGVNQPTPLAYGVTSSE